MIMISFFIKKLRFAQPAGNVRTGRRPEKIDVIII